MQPEIDLKNIIVLPLTTDGYNLLLDMLNKVPSSNKTEAIQLVSLDQQIQKSAIPAINFIKTHAYKVIDLPNVTQQKPKTDHNPNMTLTPGGSPAENKDNETEE